MATNVVNEAIAFSVMCGQLDFAGMFTDGLKRRGFCSDPEATVQVILDMPRGFALHTLEDTPSTTLQRMLVITTSTCPEYWEDLWDLRPTILLVTNDIRQDLALAIVQAARGKSYRSTPYLTTPLTPTERRVLRLLADGQTNKDIARHLVVSLQYVKNTFNIIYAKLNLKNREEGLLYYWDIWRKTR